jgi:hypothetical protein
MPRLDQFCLWLSPGLAVIALCSVANAQTTLQIMPASPRYQEPVYARIDPGRLAGGFCIYGATVSMSGADITIGLDFIIDIGCGPPYDVELGHFPTGNYTVHLPNLPGPASAQFTVGPRMPQGSTNGGGSGTVPAVNFSGMWWNALESGWGLSISQGPTNQLFAAWFVYDATGMPTWYTLELGSWRVFWNDSTYSGSVYKYAGPYFATTFDPNRVMGTWVGTGTLTFWDAYTGRFEYTIAGTSGSKVITRLPIE